MHFPSSSNAILTPNLQSGPARTYNLEMFSSLPDLEQPPSAAPAVGPVTPRRQTDAGPNAPTARRQTPSSDSPPLSPCYLPDADDIPFVLGCVSGEVFDADPPSPGGTQSKRNTIFAPRRPPPAWSIPKETGSPSPVREGGGKGLLSLFAESRESGSRDGDESEDGDEEYDEDETEVESSDGEGYETEEAGCSEWEETDVESGDDDEGEDEHGDMNDTEAETEREATSAADTEVETELEDDGVDTLGAPPSSPADDLIRIIEPLGGLIPGLTATTAAEENRSQVPTTATATPSARFARADTAWPPVTPVPNCRRAGKSG